MLRKFRLFAVFALILTLTATLAIPSSAQDDEVVDFILEALARVAEQDSVQLTTATTIDQVIDMQGMEMEFGIIQSGEGAVIYDDGEVSVASFTLAQEMDAGGMGALLGDLSLTIEVIYVDGQTYTRINTSSGLYESLFTEYGLDEWIVNESLTASLPFDLSGIIASGGNTSLDTWAEELIGNVEELDGELVNDQAMRVFSLEGDMEALFDSDAFASVLEGFDLEGMDLSSMGMDMEDLDFEMSDIDNSMGMNMVIWIGEEDGLPYYTESSTSMSFEMSMMGQAIDMTMILTEITTYSNYNEPITIEAPEID